MEYILILASVISIVCGAITTTTTRQPSLRNLGPECAPASFSFSATNIQGLDERDRLISQALILVATNSFGKDYDAINKNLTSALQIMNKKQWVEASGVDSRPDSWRLDVTNASEHYIVGSSMGIYVIAFQIISIPSPVELLGSTSTILSEKELILNLKTTLNSPPVLWKRYPSTLDGRTVDPSVQVVIVDAISTIKVLTFDSLTKELNERLKARFQRDWVTLVSNGSVYCLSDISTNVLHIYVAEIGQLTIYMFEVPKLSIPTCSTPTVSPTSTSKRTTSPKPTRNYEPPWISEDDAVESGLVAANTFVVESTAIFTGTDSHSQLSAHQIAISKFAECITNGLRYNYITQTGGIRSFAEILGDVEKWIAQNLKDETKFAFLKDNKTHSIQNVIVGKEDYNLYRRSSFNSPTGYIYYHVYGSMQITWWVAYTSD